jgi:KUP system potassium uptake protein
MVRKVLAPESNLSPRDYRTMNAKYAIRSFCGSPDRWYGLENSSVIIETVPLFSKVKPATTLKRVSSEHHLGPARPHRGNARHTGESVDIFSADMESQREASAMQAAEDLVGGHTAQFEALRPDDEGEGE